MPVEYITFKAVNIRKDIRGSRLFLNKRGGGEIKLKKKRRKKIYELHIPFCITPFSPLPLCYWSETFCTTPKFCGGGAPTSVVYCLRIYAWKGEGKKSRVKKKGLPLSRQTRKWSFADFKGLIEKCQRWRIFLTICEQIGGDKNLILICGYRRRLHLSSLATFFFCRTRQRCTKLLNFLDLKSYFAD